jgi:carboxypeptidase C (cathepsin A)
MKQVEAYALGPYATALPAGDQLSPQARQEVAKTVARYTGLSEDYVTLSDLRIEIQRFCKELLRAERRTVGRLDRRFTGLDDTGVDSAGIRSEHGRDPSAFTAAFARMRVTELNFTSDDPYHILGGGFSTWTWNRDNSFVDTSERCAGLLRATRMRLFVASGYYDLATPISRRRTRSATSGSTLAQVHERRTLQAGHMMPSTRRNSRGSGATSDVSDRALAPVTGPGAAEAPATGAVSQLPMT